MLDCVFGLQKDRRDSSVKGGKDMIQSDVQDAESLGHFFLEWINVFLGPINTPPDTICVFNAFHTSQTNVHLQMAELTWSTL